MEDQVGSAIRISIDLMVTAVLVGVLATFAYCANTGYNIKLQDDSVLSLMQSRNLLHNFDNTTVNGYDIVDAITANARLYNFEIVTTTGDYTISRANESSFDSDADINTGNAVGGTYGLKLWSADHILNYVLVDDVWGQFQATLVKDETHNLITGVKFVEKEV